MKRYTIVIDLDETEEEWVRSVIKNYIGGKLQSMESTWLPVYPDGEVKP